VTRSTSARSDRPADRRAVHHGDGVAWLRAAALPADHAIVTSLPDLSELPAGGVPAWRAWFEDAAELACRAVADDGLAIFFQTDAKHDGRWIDKAYLVQRGAERAGAHLLWHKVVCRVPPGRITFGRPAYAHLLCLSRARRLPPGRATADVLPGLGAMPWARAMGVDVCRAVVRFLRAEGVATVVDPFCGVGTILAAANEAGLAAIGVELSRKRAARARAFALA
jgi:hypothetical protein